MNSKDKGNIGDAIVLAEFVKMGIQVSIPFGDNARYDLIADFNNKLNKIQIKYCNSLSENNSIVCPCASSTNHTTNKHYSTYENDVDYFVFYLAPWDICVLVPITEIGDKKSICFRKDKPSTGNNYHLVQDYCFSSVFKIEETENLSFQTKQNYCIDCGAPITASATRCRSCSAKQQQRKVENRPSREELKNMIRTEPFTKIAQKYDVSDKSITKWCIAANLPSRKKDINSYSDEEWKSI